MTSSEDLEAFIKRHRELLSKEREAEAERSSLLLSNCGSKLLEQKGLALIGLGIVGMNVGLGGKMSVVNVLLTLQIWLDVLFGKCRLIELERPAAYHTTSIFPPHAIRYSPPLHSRRFLLIDSLGLGIWLESKRMRELVLRRNHPNQRSQKQISLWIPNLLKGLSTK